MGIHGDSERNRVLIVDVNYMVAHRFRATRMWEREEGSLKTDKEFDDQFLQKFTDQTLTSTAPEDPW